jgi:hypothetical protein
MTKARQEKKETRGQKKNVIQNDEQNATTTYNTKDKKLQES